MPKDNRPHIRFAIPVFDRICQLAIRKKLSLAATVIDYLNTVLEQQGEPTIPYPERGRPRKVELSPKYLGDTRRDFDDY